MFREGPLRRFIRERFRRRERISGRSAEVEVEKILTVLSQAKVDITYAEDYVKAGDYEGAHRHISRAHKNLREASRLLVR